MPTVQKLRLLAQLKMENGLQETLDLVPDSLKTERSQPPEYRPQRLQSFRRLRGYQVLHAAMGKVA